MSMARVAVLMSGGVDSAFAALHLKRQGHLVEGFTGVFHDEGPVASSDDAASAYEVCRALRIPHASIDLRSDFKRCVVDSFVEAYTAGRTPNPCAWCNRDIKLGKLARLVLDRGSEFVATGHYARQAVVQGRKTLCRALDRRRSQVYFLAIIDPGILPHLILPAGDFKKEEVRRAVRNAGLPTHDRESQDLCFMGGRTYHTLLHLRGRDGEPGRVLDSKGNVVGTHRGHTAYTPGQRFGLRGRRLYVLEKRPGTNIIVIGERQEAFKTQITATVVSHFLPLVGNVSSRLCIRYRYNSPPVGARILETGSESVTVSTDEPCFAPARGQILAGFRDECLVFGGVILSAE
jgi:tRNA-specific 2-thiouridylase